MNTRVSVIIPVYNELEQLEASISDLASWLNSDVVEVIWVDGGSVDGTFEWLQSNNYRVIRSQKGRANQMNAGAQLASGELLMFLHVDTLLPVPDEDFDGSIEDFIKSLQESLHSTKKEWGRFDVAISGASKLFKMIAWFMNQRSRISGIATGDQTIFILRDAFDSLQGFPIQPLMEDIEMSKRLKSFSHPLCIKVKVITSGRRWEQGGIWNTILLMWKLRFLYWCGVPVEKLAEMYK